MNNTIITTFGKDIYILKGMSPDEFREYSKNLDEVIMPNGSSVNRKSIATIQSYEDYNFQVEQKKRHKQGQFLKNGSWHDLNGNLGINAQLERITGELLLKDNLK